MVPSLVQELHSITQLIELGEEASLIRINYPSACIINKQLNELIRLPVYSIGPETLHDYERNYFEKCRQGSETLTEQAKERIPGGIQHDLAFNHPFPPVITKAVGHELTDIDGNVYFDFLQAGGPTVLGSNSPEVRGEVIKLLQDCGLPTGLFHEYEYKLTDLVASCTPTVDQFHMLGLGTEAYMAAIRTARLATKKKHILRMGGAYYGWSDQLAYGIRVPGSKLTQAHGVSWTMFHYVDEFRPGSLTDLERRLRLKRLHGDTAAVMTESIGPEPGIWPINQAFLRGVEKLCCRYGALLIFNEAVTTLRISDRGAPGLFGINTDLTVFGEVIAGGYPGAGGLGDEKEYLKYLAAGIQNGDKVHRTLIGDTMATTPISCVARYHTIKYIIEAEVYECAGKMSNRLTDGLKTLVQRYGLPFMAWNGGSACRLEAAKTMHFSTSWSKPWTVPGILKETLIHKKEMEYMGATYTAEGLIILTGSRLCTSAAYTPGLIDETLTRFERTLQKMVKK